MNEATTTPDTTDTSIATRAEVEQAIQDLDAISLALDGPVGGEFADGLLAWLSAVERVQRTTKTWDTIKTPPEQIGEALHARLGGVTSVFGMFASRGSRPRTFSDFAARARTRALKAIEERVE